MKRYNTIIAVLLSLAALTGCDLSRSNACSSAGDGAPDSLCVLSDSVETEQGSARQELVRFMGDAEAKREGKVFGGAGGAVRYGASVVSSRLASTEEGPGAPTTSAFWEVESL